MRRARIAIAAAIVFCLAFALPATADQALLMYRTGDGALHGARVGDLESFLDGCGLDGPADPTPVAAVRLVSADREQALVAYHVTGEDAIYFRAGPGAFLERDTWCRASSEVLRGLERERRLPANRGPWLALIASFGFLAIVIGLLAVWGGGVGPRPKLNYPDDEHGHGHSTGEAQTAGHH